MSWWSWVGRSRRTKAVSDASPDLDALTLRVDLLDKKVEAMHRKVYRDIAKGDGDLGVLLPAPSPVAILKPGDGPPPGLLL